MKVWFFIICGLMIAGCSTPDQKESGTRQQGTTTGITKEWTNPEFPFSDFADSVTAVAKKNGFDTLAVNGTREITDFSRHFYVSKIIAKGEINKADTGMIVFLYNVTLKSNSVKKPDSPDMTADIYCFADTASCLFWKKQLKKLYHQSGGEPLKELYYLEDFGNILLHTTTRAFMWEGELDAFHEACVKFMNNLSATER